MSEEQRNRAVIVDLTKAYNEGRIDELIDTYFAPAAHLRHVTRGIDLRGREPLRELFREVLARFPDRRSEILRSYASGDIVVAEKRWEATEASSGDKVVAEMCYVFRLEDGMVVEQREYG